MAAWSKAFLAFAAAVAWAWFAHRAFTQGPASASSSAFGWLVFLQHAGIHAGLGLLFGASLRRGAVPLCTRMARLVHGELCVPMQRYSRTVTLAWTVFFAAVTLASTVLFLGGATWWWSLLANVLSLPLVVAMFMVEGAVRRRRLPHIEHVSAVQSFRAFTRLREAPAAQRTRT